MILTSRGGPLHPTSDSPFLDVYSYVEIDCLSPRSDVASSLSASLQYSPVPHAPTLTIPLLDLMDTQEASVVQWLATWIRL